MSCLYCGKRTHYGETFSSSECADRWYQLSDLEQLEWDTSDAYPEDNEEED